MENDDQPTMHEKLAAEAASVVGTEWSAVERYIADRVAALNEADRLVYFQQIQRVVDFNPPPGPVLRRKTH